MMAHRTCVLALAARHGRIAYVLIIDGQPKAWALSCIGAKSRTDAARVSGAWMAKFDPDVIVIEDAATARRKKSNTKALLRAMHRVAARGPASVATPPRVQRFANKHEEAAHFVAAYPQLESKMSPKRRCWKPEPRNIIYFEALALAQEAGFLRQGSANAAD